MSGPAQPAGLPFIVSSDAQRFDPATRKLIRSHVMRGRNAKRTTRRLPSGLELALHPARRPGTFQADMDGIQKLYAAPSPERIGARLYFIGFPQDVDPQLFLDMERVSGVALRILFPLLAELGFQNDERPWLHPSGQDPVALYISAFASQIFMDRVLRQQPEDKANPVSMLHLQKGLKLLRERLGGPDEEAKISDATIGAVLDLATAALFHGDALAAKQHIRGLGKMIQLRGGLQSLTMNPGFVMEVLRCDLSIALVTETDPIFYCRIGKAMHKFPDEIFSTFDSIEKTEFLTLLNLDLAEVWLSAKKFCLLVSLAAQTQKQFHPSTIYEAMTSTMYRLLQMSFATGSWEETIRLGLLVFTHHVFLQGQQVKLPWNPLSQAYRSHIQACQARPATQMGPPHIILWLLMVGAISIFNIPEEEWLSDALRRWTQKCHVATWKGLQAVLKSCMWIPVLDDRLGQQIYDLVSFNE